MDRGVIGRKVKQLREKQGMTAAELSRIVGLSQGQISRIENGRQGLRSATLLRIADALGVRPIRFFMENDEEKQVTPLIYGLVAGGKLAEALESPEFVAILERLADAFLRRRDAFLAVQYATKAIVGDEE